ncbi:MAG TPA: IspD/TarI family cytidylyltransferase [Clostridiales bacterium]|nr:IspD/TarI family cytidylyltransferase [Clostridiales bacterium]
MIAAVILAAGNGSRMAGSLPKQFLKIEGKPVLVRTVEAFLRSDLVDRVVVAVAKDWLDYAERLLEEAFGGAAPISVTVGGSSRLQSLINACAFLSDAFGITKDDIVLTHDAARPFVTKQVIAENIKLLDSYDGVTTACPAVDTILVSADGKKVDDIPLRKTMFSVQTPQTFHTGELIETIASLTEAEKSALTDAAKAYVLKKKRVGIVLSETTNLKLTTAADLSLAASLMLGEK